MNIDDAIKKIDGYLADFDQEMAKISEELAINAKSLIIHRIQTEGLPGRQYSKHKLPEFFFEGRELNGGGKALLEKHSKKAARDEQRAAGEKVRKNKALDELEDGISYEEWRRANGLQTNFIDLTFSGRSFQNVGVIATEKRGDIYITIVGAFNEETRQKLRYNAIRFGDFFVVNEQEQKMLNELYRTRLNNYTENYFK